MTSPIAIVWSPPAISSRSSHTAHASGPFDHRRALLEPVRHPIELLALGELRGEDARELALLRAQHVDSKPAGLAHDREGPRLVFEADQRQERVQRQRAEGVRGHAALARGPGTGDHRDSGGKPPEYFAKQFRIERRGHGQFLYGGAHARPRGRNMLSGLPRARILPRLLRGAVIRPRPAPAGARVRRGDGRNEEKAPAPTSGCRRRKTIALAWEANVSSRRRGCHQSFGVGGSPPSRRLTVKRFFPRGDSE